MMELLQRFYLLAVILLVCGAGCFNGKPVSSPSDEKYTEQNALGMIRTSRETLAPVYAPLAEQIVSDFDLAK